ncbi:response regulator transcription factor [Cellvibrio sp. PSBB023]|uniref:response regulator transcription factor n=1 Tax=Cellvibrio sp. PSBB023 TaxID=1945512 RepID=UPI001FF03AF7|nr:response regulator [Cellvibrio sp. PSBB023]
MLASITNPQRESITAPVQTIYGYQGAVRRLLLVDDDASHRQLMRAMLSPLGFDIIDMDNPLAVVTRYKDEVAQGTAPDLIMLDVSMPEMSGWQVAEQLRAQDYHGPILMVSADASEGKEHLANTHHAQEPQTDAPQPPLHNAYVIM